jgi:hypothetical protein
MKWTGLDGSKSLHKMKLGIITDIHEAVDQLRAALRILGGERVDRIVVVGDIMETGDRIEETCRLLADAGVIGVWGNHDFGLCYEPEEATREGYSDQVLTFMGSLKPRLEIGDCHFCHVEPWLDPLCLMDLWYYDENPKSGGVPDIAGRLNQIFQAVPHRLLFAGHYHRWFSATPQQASNWKGDSELPLGNSRHFIVLGALFNGDFAVLDTEANALIPLHTGLPTARC